MVKKLYKIIKSGGKRWKRRSLPRRGQNLIRPKRKCHSCLAYQSKPYTVMNSVGVPYQPMWNDRCFSCCPAKRENGENFQNNVGWLKNVPRNDVKNVPPMNIMRADSAGWLMEQYVNVKPRKTGRKKWQYAVNVRLWQTFFNNYH
jgi:hypothetical protein